MKTLSKAVLGSLFIVSLLFSTVAQASHEGEIVPATYQDRVYFSSHGSDVRVAFFEHGITTLTFRVYDKALLDVSLEKGHLDGKPGKHPKVTSDAHLSNAFRDNATLTFGSIGHSSETINGLKVLPLYQTTSGFRIYYVVDSYRETGSDARRFKFFVRKPAGK